MNIAKTIFLILTCSAVSFGQVVLVREGKDPCPIVIPAEPEKNTEQAAASLAKYLEQISGAKFTVQKADAPWPAPAIVLEPLDSAAATDLGDEGFQIETRDGRLHIRGSAARGLSYGVYAFLEEAIGCRWWSHNEEDVPQKATIELSQLDIQSRPAFAMHRLFNREAQSGLNDFAVKLRSTGTLHFSGGHTLYPLLTPYAKEHPEIYPMDKNGERKGNKLHFCYLAPGISEALTEALSAQVEKRKGNVKDTVYFAGMGDWYGGQCQCEACKAVYQEEAWTNADNKTIPGYTGTLLRMINRTAEQLDKKYPGIRVGTFAYMSLEAPPAKTVPRENVVIRVPRLRHCTVHAADECQKNRAFYLNVERWCQLAPGRVTVWDYGANFTNFMLPFPCFRSMAENVKLYHKMGISGIEIQGNYVSTGGDMAVAKNYVWGKLMWDPAQPTDQLLNEFCRGYYGPADDDVLAYIAKLETGVREPKMIHADEFSKPQRAYLPPEFVAELRGILEAGLARTAGNDSDPYYRRLRELMVSIEAAVLWTEGPLEERDGHLVRTDLGGNTFQRALDLDKYCRQASPREWSSGRRYRLQFLSWHGGPIATLESGRVSVKVAPLQNGRVGPITFDGRELLRETLDHAAGGGRIYRFDGEPSATAATIEGELGISLWGAHTKQIGRRHVKVNGEGKIELTGSLRWLIGKKNQPASAQVATAYPVDRGQDPPRVEWRDASGAWHGTTLEGEPPQATVEGLTAWRVTLPQRGAVVVDKYSAPNDDSRQPNGVYSGQVQLDPKARSVTTTVQIAIKQTIPNQDQDYIHREIEIAPLSN